MGLFSLFGKSRTVYFPGCRLFFKHRDNFELYLRIFNKLGIDFRILDDYVCCGLRALEAGYESEAWKLARRNFDIFNEEGALRLISSSPECYYMFLKKYPEMIPYWNIEIDNIWEMISEKLAKKSRLIKNKAMEIVGFHDNCYLGRGCGIYESPRRILELIGYEIKELPNSREDSFCCGSCGGLVDSNKELADKIAKERILQAKRIGVGKLIVLGFENYELLRKNVGDSGVEVLELSEVLGLALGLMFKKEEEEVVVGEDKIFSEMEVEKRFEEEVREEEYYEGSGEDEWK